MFGYYLKKEIDNLPAARAKMMKTFMFLFCYVINSFDRSDEAVIEEFSFILCARGTLIDFT